MSLADPRAAPLTREAVPAHAEPFDDRARWNNRLLRDVGDRARRPVHPTRSRVLAWLTAIMVAMIAIAALVIFDAATMKP